MAIYFFYQTFGINGLASFLLWLLATATLPELAIGLVALWQGDDTARSQGKLTLNPAVHLAPMRVLMLLLVGFAWSVIPIDPSNFRWGRRGRIPVYGAGILMNAALWFMCWSALGLLLAHELRFTDGSRADLMSIFRTLPDGMTKSLAVFLLIGGTLNGILALGNMLPIPPCFGAHVLAGASRHCFMWLHDPRVQYAGFFILLVVLFSGAGGVLLRFADKQGLRLSMLIAGA